MQTYSLGFSTTGPHGLPNHVSSKQTHLQIPYASLTSHDTVLFGTGYKSTKDRRDQYEHFCRSIGVTNTEIQAIKTTASQSDKVKKADSKNKFSYRIAEEYRLLRAEYLKRVENKDGEYDGAHDSVSEPE